MNCTGGRNLVPGKPDIQLFDTSFNDVTSNWTSRPVRFSSTPALTSYGQITDVAGVGVTGSFAFMASIYREETLDFALLEFETDADFLLHIWIYHDAFYVSILFDACSRVKQYYSSTMDNHQWRIVAVSYDITTGVLLMWVDGEQETYHSSPCTSAITAPQRVYVNLR